MDNIDNIEEFGEFVTRKFLDGTNKTDIAKLWLSGTNPTHTEIDTTRKKVSNYLARNGLGSINLLDTKEYQQAKLRVVPKSKFYIITSAQNHTKVEAKALKNLKAYAEHLGGELIVLLGRYNSNRLINDYWDPAIEEYSKAGRLELPNDLIVRGDLQVGYSVKKPLTRIHSLEGGKSLILAHPKLHQSTDATLQGYTQKTAYTTGSITKANYTNSVSGAYSESKHKIGFLVVEVSQGYNIVRQIEMDASCNFEDLILSVKNGRVINSKPAKGIVFGDIHLRHATQERLDCIYKYINLTSPKYIVLHDLFDGETVNFHIKHKPTEKAHLLNTSTSVRILDEMKEVKDFLHSFKYLTKVLIPIANHHERLDRALELDWRDDIINYDFYLDYTKLKIEGGLPRGVLAHYLEEDKRLNFVTCFSHLDSFKIGKFEVAHHGHFGVNGARGAVTSYVNLNIPVILGHTHSGIRFDDCLYAGFNTAKNVGYNERGASGWSRAEIVITNNGLAVLSSSHSNGDITMITKILK